MKKSLIITLLILTIAGIAIYKNREALIVKFFEPTTSAIKEGELNSGEIPALVVIAENLNIPWEIEFLPGGDVLLTERGGKLIRIGEDRKMIEVSGVLHRGEGGLLGLALHPDFEQNGFIYLYLTTEAGGTITNQVERYKLDGATTSLRKVIIDGIPGASIHDGGRIAFGSDGMLYITTGDAGMEDKAQDIKSLAGKILRINADGSIPTDNPFGNAVYSYGHRNAQGIVWDDAGQLWSTEHGRSGVQSGYDELNKIIKGANYGWPNIEGSETAANMITPELHSGASDTWAPAGIEYYAGHVVFAGLRGQALYVADISSGRVGNIEKFFNNTYGRLRTVKLGPDGMFYLLTNNRDGRGQPNSSDDIIIKVVPESLGL